MVCLVVGVVGDGVFLGGGWCVFGGFFVWVMCECGSVG